MMELVLVLAVIAISAAIAAPALSGFAHGRVLPNSVTDLVTVLRWCRVKALSDGIEYRLNLDRPANTWWVTKDDGSGTTFVDVTDDDLGRAYVLPEGIVIQDIEYQTVRDAAKADEGTYIPFLPGGRTEAARITLASDRRVMAVECVTPLGTYHIAEEVPK